MYVSKAKVAAVSRQSTASGRNHEPRVRPTNIRLRLTPSPQREGTPLDLFMTPALLLCDPVQKMYALP